MSTIAFELNRDAWDLLVPVHECSDFYDVKGFLEGHSSLRCLEQSLVGDCRGKDLLHLQCHFGLDSLSWARLGANVTGVDFSPVAIKTARRLAAACGVEARFECCDVQQLTLEADFDVVVTTYGVLCWLQDLEAWARGIYSALRTRGRLIVVEFHPMLEALHPGKMTGARSYFGSEVPSIVQSSGTYADRSAPLVYQEARWQHSVADILSALLRAGLTVTGFDEYPFCSYGLFDELEESQPGIWTPRAPVVWPYMLSIQAHKPA